VAGLLILWNRITAEDDAGFNAWYEDEHLAERLSVPGFLSARRYRDVAEPLAYCAVYETGDVAVLDSAAYRARLADPTPRTRAIMPRFLDMTRAACRVVSDSAPGTPAAAHLLIVSLTAPWAGASPVPACLRWRSVVPDPQLTGGRTSEQALRPAADRLAPPLVLIEANDAADISAASDALRDGVAAPRHFRLLSSRG
jgi:hypothetical protein